MFHQDIDVCNIQDVFLADPSEQTDDSWPRLASCTLRPLCVVKNHTLLDMGMETQGATRAEHSVSTGAQLGTKDGTLYST